MSEMDSQEGGAETCYSKNGNNRLKEKAAFSGMWGVTAVSQGL